MMTDMTRSALSAVGAPDRSVGILDERKSKNERAR